ncbi:transglycosylase domain-containing protein [Magnetofaba australis]|uniref:Putative glycosyl transferase family protein n=1 Tax=Magnetofaba australis IT-1 TaxID=1434232 RepID=A0A1Y2K6D3_9PROT|nr:transglycosylase domain-containing protein [Magnetofaba australis]OSM03991.1 putative glycosyl transferase family protein [Magnetofaba australis IT-1]
MTTVRAIVYISLLLMLAGVLYVSIEVWSEHQQTPKLVAEAQALLRADRERPGAVTPADLPDAWRTALLQAADPGFAEHDGLDRSTPGAGTHTIAQNVAAIMRLHMGLETRARGKLTLSAQALTKQLGRDAVLTLYLNHVPLGEAHGAAVAGLPDAARSYFQTSLSQLSFDQFLQLVAMLEDPARYHLQDQPEANAARVARIHALLDGRCKPDGVLDVEYARCPSSVQNK